MFSLYYYNLDRFSNRDPWLGSVSCPFVLLTVNVPLTNHGSGWAGGRLGQELGQSGTTHGWDGPKMHIQFPTCSVHTGLGPRDGSSWISMISWLPPLSGRCKYPIGIKNGNRNAKIKGDVRRDWAGMVHGFCLSKILDDQCLRTELSYHWAIWIRQSRLTSRVAVAP